MSVTEEAASPLHPQSPDRISRRLRRTRPRGVKETPGHVSGGIDPSSQGACLQRGGGLCIHPNSRQPPEEKCYPGVSGRRPIPAFYRTAVKQRCGAVVYWLLLQTATADAPVSGHPYDAPPQRRVPASDEAPPRRSCFLQRLFALDGSERGNLSGLKGSGQKKNQQGSQGERRQIRSAKKNPEEVSMVTGNPRQERNK